MHKAKNIYFLLNKKKNEMAQGRLPSPIFCGCEASTKYIRPVPDRMVWNLRNVRSSMCTLWLKIIGLPASTFFSLSGWFISTRYPVDY